MDSGKKKLRKQECDDGEVEDRLISLPDNLIHHIFSSIPTKYVVATSVLSTRWYSLWKSISNLDICDQLLHSPGTASSDAMVKTSFMNFVDRVLSLHSASTLTKFSLSCHEVYYDTRVNAWISTAFSCNVKELILSIRLEHQPSAYPHHLLHCESLTKLEISIKHRFHLKVSKSICFPNLKYLDLSCVWFCGDHSALHVFLSFPVLEVFFATELRLLKIATVEISAPLLKTLIIDQSDERYEIKDHEKIIIDAQSVVRLNFSETFMSEYSIYNTSSVLDATIDVLSADRLIELLEGMGNVKRLSLNICTTDTLLTFDTLDLPTFSSLVDLAVALPDSSLDLGHLIQVLHKMPKLESLEFDAPYTCEFHEIGVAPASIPQSLPSHLKTVTVCGFGGCDFEIDLVKLFLQNARSLDRIILSSYGRISGDPKNDVEVMKQLLMIPRASPHCRIDFS